MDSHRMIRLSKNNVMHQLQWSPQNRIPFFHGTSQEAWKRIQKEQVLWGVTTGYRYTYLTPDIGIACEYGPVILRVLYTPTGIRGMDNFGFHPPSDNEFCWQFSVFVPIPIDRIMPIDIMGS